MATIGRSAIFSVLWHLRHHVLIGFDSSLRSATTETSMYAQGKQKIRMNRVETTARKTQRQRPLVLFFATRGGYKMEENDLSLSLYVHTLCNYLYKITTTQSMCPKSYLYIYDFRDIYIYVHTNRSYRSEPDLGSAGSLYLPSGGTCFPTTWSKPAGCTLFS